MPNKTPRSILDKLIQSADNVRGEFSYADDIERNLDLQVSVALKELAEWVDGKRKNVNRQDGQYWEESGFNSAIDEIKKELIK